MDISDHGSFTYELALGVRGSGYHIVEERLAQKGSAVHIHLEGRDASVFYRNPRTSGLEAPDWDLSNQESALSQVPKIYRVPEALRQFLASSVTYSANRLNLMPHAPIRLPQKVRPVSRPGMNGESLVSYLYHLREIDDIAYQVIADTLAVAFPGFTKLSFPPVASGAITMTWHEATFVEPLYPNQLSEGMLRFLWLLALLTSPELPEIVMIDEPEVSLHPQMISLLVGLMREASSRSRIIVASHSDALIRFSNPHEMVITDLEDGLTRFRRADELDLDHWS